LQKTYNLSKPLVDFAWRNSGEKYLSKSGPHNTKRFQLSRPQVVKMLWDYIKAHELQDSSDKRYIICDENMQEVFKTDRVHMFTMNRILSNHLFAKE
jgi:upstream activation factor subunit UAF30